MPFVRVYFRETQELFDAHDKAFQFYGGVCRRCIYDNMKTAVETIFVGKARRDELYPLIASLIRAERIHRQARSISYRIAGAKFPVLRVGGSRTVTEPGSPNLHRRDLTFCDCATAAAHSHPDRHAIFSPDSFKA